MNVKKEFPKIRWEVVVTEVTVVATEADTAVATKAVGVETKVDMAVSKLPNYIFNKIYLFVNKIIRFFL